MRSIIIKSSVIFLFLAFMACSDDDDVSYSPDSQNDIKRELLSVLKKMGITEKTRETLNWKMGSPLNSWIGVNHEGIYLSLNIRDVGLNGKIPAELFKLPHLKRLNVADNDLKGNIPEGILQAEDLEYADFTGNRLNGKIPDTIKSHHSYRNFKFLAQQKGSVLTNAAPVEENAVDKQVLLDMLYKWGADVSTEMLDTWTEDNYLSDFSGVFLDGKGKVVSLYLNGVSEIPEEILNLDKLVSLEIQKSNLDGLSLIPGLPALTTVTLSECSLDSIPVNWKRDQHIVELAFKDCKFKKGLPSVLFDMANLKMLSVVDCGLNGTIPSELFRLTNLVYLDLSDNDFKALPDEPENMKNLISLDLSGNAFISIDGRLMKNLKMLRLLDLSDNSCRGKIPDELGELVNLEYLSLKGNKFLGMIPNTLKRLRNLEFIDISNCRDLVEQPFPDFIFELPVIKSINLSNSTLNGYIPPKIGNLRNVHTLFLNGNKLVGSLPESLYDMKYLFNADFTYNNLGGEIPKRLFDHPYFLLWKIDPQNSGFSFTNYPDYSFQGNARQIPESSKSMKEILKEEIIESAKMQ